MIKRQKVSPRPGTVLFIVGMRINKVWAVNQWFPVIRAMGRMLKEQESQPIGVVGKSQAFRSGRLFQIQQYWSSLEALKSYAANPDFNHHPAWRTFYSAGRTGAVGLYHEIYVIDQSNHENLFVNIDEPILIATTEGK